MKEAQRLSGTSAGAYPSERQTQRVDLTTVHVLVTLNRKALVDFTLSDGTVIPAGTTVAIAALPVHYDEVGV